MNTNPFEPVSPEPATFEPTDNAPDDFMADNSNLRGKPARPAVMLDGVSPAPGFNAMSQNNSFEPTTTVVDAVTTDDAAVENSLEATETNSDTPSAVDQLESATSADSLLNDNEPLSDGFLNDTSSSSVEASPVSPAVSAPINKKDDKKSTKKAAKGEKPPRQFTISIASIILFLLAAGGIGGSVYFYMQNNSNLNKNKTYQAQIAELQNNGASTSDSENKTSSQFDALQDKITELTKQNEAKQKTIDENKIKIDDLTKKNNDLTKTNEDLTKKVQSISDLTTRVDTMLNKLDNLLAN